MPAAWLSAQLAACVRATQAAAAAWLRAPWHAPAGEQLQVKRRVVREARAQLLVRHFVPDQRTWHALECVPACVRDRAESSRWRMWDGGIQGHKRQQHSLQRTAAAQHPPQPPRACPCTHLCTAPTAGCQRRRRRTRGSCARGASPRAPCVSSSPGGVRTKQGQAGVGQAWASQGRIVSRNAAAPLPCLPWKRARPPGQAAHLKNARHM